jgi:hypothetical protein
MLSFSVCLLKETHVSMNWTKEVTKRCWDFFFVINLQAPVVPQNTKVDVAKTKVVS